MTTGAGVLTTLTRIDLRHWSALTRLYWTLLKRDAIDGYLGVDHKTRLNRPALVVLAVGLVVVGFALGMGASQMTRLADAAVACTVAAMLLNVSVVLLNQKLLLGYREDGFLIPVRAVTAQSYLAARLSVAIIQATAVTWALGLGIAGALLIFVGPKLGLIVSGAAALTLASAVSVSVLILGFAWCFQIVPRSLAASVAMYFQLAGLAVVWAVATVPLGGQLERAERVVFADAWRFYPPAWFASIGLVGQGDAGQVPVALWGLGCCLLAVLWFRFGFSHRFLLALYESAVNAGRRGRHTRVTATAIAGRSVFQALTTVIRAQARFDSRFQWRLLGTLPLGIVLIGSAIADGDLGDPFAFGLSEVGWLFVPLQVLIVAICFQYSLPVSDSYKAAWIYATAPVKPVEFLRATRRAFVACIGMPYVLAVWIVVGLATGYLGRYAVHLGLLAIVAGLFVQAFQYLQPEVPFSRREVSAQQGVAQIGLTLLLGFCGLAIMPSLQWLVYPRAAWIVVVASLTLSWLVAMERRLDRRFADVQSLRVDGN